MRRNGTRCSTASADGNTHLRRNRSSRIAQGAEEKTGRARGPARTAAGPPLEAPGGGSPEDQRNGRPDRADAADCAHRPRASRANSRRTPTCRASRPDSPALFRWECGPSGEIAWVEGAPRGALIGRSIALAGNGEGEGVDRAVERAFALRSPFRDAGFSLAGDGVLVGPLADQRRAGIRACRRAIRRLPRGRAPRGSDAAAGRRLAGLAFARP